MPSLKMSAAGRTVLTKEEGSIDGLYDDPVGLCTFGVGHLVHAADKWSGFLQAAAQSNPAWKAQLAKTPTTPALTYVGRSTSALSDWTTLQAKAIELGTATVAKKKHGKPVDQLTDAERAAARSAAEAAVRREVEVLGKTVPDVLVADLSRFEAAVNSTITGLTLTQDEFDALVTLSFNIGPENFKTSTVARKVNENKYRIGSDIAAREAAIAEIEAAFAMWNKSGGAVMRGLIARRKRESDWFLKGARDAVVAMKAGTSAANL